MLLRVGAVVDRLLEGLPIELSIEIESVRLKTGSPNVVRVTLGYELQLTSEDQTGSILDLAVAVESLATLRCPILRIGRDQGFSATHYTSQLVATERLLQFTAQWLIYVEELESGTQACPLIVPSEHCEILKASTLDEIVSLWEEDETVLKSTRDVGNSEDRYRFLMELRAVGQPLEHALIALGRSYRKLTACLLSWTQSSAVTIQLPPTKTVVEGIIVTGIGLMLTLVANHN